MKKIQGKHEIYIYTLKAKLLGLVICLAISNKCQRHGPTKSQKLWTKAPRIVKGFTRFRKKRKQKTKGFNLIE